MGYTTNFSGEFKITPTLKPEHRAYLKRFAETRRMKRYLDPLLKAPDPLRIAVDLPLTDEGAYYVGSPDEFGQDFNVPNLRFDASRPEGHGNFKTRPNPNIKDDGEAPRGQPGLWCKWAPTEDGTALEWDGREKFYEARLWAVYLLEHFLTPWGYKVQGRVRWAGEEPGDTGTLVIEDGRVEEFPDPY